jgi:hypothetical protein
MLIAMKCPKQAYERDPKILHLYVKEIRILTPNNYEQEKNINKTESSENSF